MANIPVLTDEQWDALRAASIKGVPDTQLAETFGVDGSTIRIKRFRDETWKAAVSATRSLIASQSQKVTGNETKGPEAASLAKKVSSTISENVASLSENNLLLANRLAQKGLERAVTAIDGVELQNMGDIERAVKIAAIAGKWNQPQVNVSQAFAFGGGQDDSAIVECDTEIVEDAGNYGDAFNLDEQEG